MDMSQIGNNSSFYQQTLDSFTTMSMIHFCDSHNLSPRKLVQITIMGKSLKVQL